MQAHGPAGEAESDDEDPFADIDSEDDEELENNEILEIINYALLS